MKSTAELESRIAELERRLGELEDERAIRELLARYGYNADCRRDEAWVNLYTEDGAMDMNVASVSGADGAENTRRWQGRAEVTRFITHPKGHHRPGYYGNTLHLQGNNVVTHIEGNAAVVNSYSFGLHRKPEVLEVIGGGNNQWTLKKIDGRWLIEERRTRNVGNESFIQNMDKTPE